jgi:hypothetical protein
MQLGELKRLNPRDVWANEARDFTPWLADHLEELGEALGMDLELEKVEMGVGRYSADIVARDLGTQRRVVIENQLEPTDHGHLGQIITYAAGLKASVVVWVCPEMREEHRQALDWLNLGHGEGTDFFGVIVELIQIDDSAPAANFRPIAFPNDWSHNRVGRSPGPTGGVEPSSRMQRYQAYYQDLIDELRDGHRFTNARVGQPQNWYSFAAGYSGLQYSTSFAGDGRIRAGLYIDRGDEEENTKIFDLLFADRSAIEAALDQEVEWERLAGRRACRVTCHRAGSIDDASDELEAHRRWVVDCLLKFKAVVGPRLNACIQELG